MSDQPASPISRPNCELRDSILKHFPIEKFNENAGRTFKGFAYCDILGEDGIDALRRYLYHGCPTGDFLEAVLSNDLTEAFGRADDHNQSILHWWVAFVYNYFPIVAWKSKQAVKAWIKLHQDCRDEKEQERAG